MTLIFGESKLNITHFGPRQHVTYRKLFPEDAFFMNVEVILSIFLNVTLRGKLFVQHHSRQLWANNELSGTCLPVADCS